MAPPAGTLRVGRYFISLLAIFAVLYGIVFWPGQSRTPRLGLDLEGGIQIVYQAHLAGGKTPSKATMSEAQQIMEQRVNGLGVSEATVVVQGADQLVVSIPTKSPKDIANLGAAAVLNFRPVVMPPVAAKAATTTPTTSGSATTSGSPTAPASSGATSSAPASTAGSTPAKTSPAAVTTGSASKSAQALNAQPLAAGTTAATSSAAPSSSAAAGSTAPAATPSGTAAASPSPSASSTAATKPSADPLAGLTFTIPTNDTAYNTLTADQQTQLQTALANFDCSARPDDVATKDYIACDPTGTEVFLMGPVIVPGNQISSANSVNLAANGSGGGWAVSLNLKSSGQAAWAKYTGAHHSATPTGSSIASVETCSASTTPCAEYVAFTLDGTVLSTPHNEAAINGGATQISGSFTQSSANTLANQLNYGALPVTFGNPLSQTTVSATLGTGQLKAGLLAGGIGLILVVIYSLIYYRALGLVTVASLLVSGGLTYASLVILGRQIGFTLSLAGIAGFIVAVGITADSFVVFFERIKDEVHDGRSARTAVPRAWVRARRTILSADTVSFLAAAVLYYFAAGDVKGFAFTLGLSTILDLVVVFLFTHPLVSWLSRSRAFGSARFTGLNSARTGGIVVSEAQQREDREALRRSGKAPAKRRPVRDDEPVERPGSSVAVLDDEEFAAADEIEVADDSVADDSEPEAPRVRTTPEPGSAAERAAARRARLRAENADEKGQN